MVLSLAASLLSGCRCSDGPSSANSPEQMFRALVADPVPAAVSRIEGVGDTWQGHSVFLRFATSPQFLEAHLKQGFEREACARVLQRLELPAGYDRFTPKWRPQDVSRPECYASRDSQTAGVRWHGDQYLLFDRSRSVVYLYAVGQ